MSKQFYFSVNNCSISNNSVQYTKIVLFQVIQFSISIKFNSIWPIDRTLRGATTPGQSGPESDGNEGVLCIPQSSSNITGISLSNCLVSYPRQPLVGRVLHVWKDAVSVFYSHNQLGNYYNVTVQHFSHYVIETTLHQLVSSLIMKK